MSSVSIGELGGSSVVSSSGGGSAGRAFPCLFLFLLASTEAAAGPLAAVTRAVVVDLVVVSLEVGAADIAAVCMCGEGGVAWAFI